ncbi:MAG: universal stress protein [Bernardetiaceae bacterium]|jgi:nucleotide-binding universal stress UspA family protein|nr:universal stress protein [Bernardetiaceae bacterium]
MKNLLVPTDFSENAKGAMAYAVQLAAALGAKLHFYHATGRVIPRVADQALYHRYREDYLAEHRDDLQEQVWEVYHQLGIEQKAAEANLLVREGELLLHVGELVAELAIDLIVMGTHGATGLKRWFVGSNTAGVFTQAACPVLAVPAGYRYRPIKKIGYASDLTKLDREVPAVVAFARPFGAAIDVVHVYPVFPVQVDLATLDREALAAQLGAQHHYEKIQIKLVRTEVDNDVEAGIEEYASEDSPSLLVMFNHTRSWFDRIIEGSHTRQQLMTSELPLLALKN